MKNYLFLLFSCFLLIAGGALGYPNPIENQTNVVVTNVWDLGYDTLYVGQTTAGNSLTVEQGGSVTSGYGVVGYNSWASGNSVVIQGTNSSWVSSDGIAVGSYGSDNTLSVLDQASVTIGNLSLGESSGATNNTFEVNNATATINANLQTGGSASRFLLSNGGKVVTSDNLVFRTDNNTVQISGEGSVLTNSSESAYLDFMSASGNRLLVSNGGTLAGFSDFWTGYSGGTDNLFALSGTGTTVNLRLMGIGGVSNRVEVTGGAQLQINDAMYLQTSGDALTISDSGSVCSASDLDLGSGVNPQISVTNGGLLQIGSINPSGSGSLTLDILSGGRVETSGNLEFTSDRNTVTVSGAGSVLTNSSESAYLDFMSASGSRLLVSNGGTLAGFSDFWTGYSGGTDNLFALSGTGTTVNLRLMGIGGVSNRVEVTGGAQLQINDAMYLQTSGDALTISDSGSVCSASDLDLGSGVNPQISVTNGGLLQIGSINPSGSGSLTLDILSGGCVETSGNLEFTSDRNTVTVSGEGSELHQDSGCFYFSGAGNRMLISAGGTLNSGGIVIGGPVGSTNNVMTVLGANTFVATEDINLSGESNRLLIDQGATVQAYWLGLHSGAALDVENGAFESQRLWMESGGVMALTAKPDEPPVRITDTATLNGILSVRLDGGVVPAKDDRFYLFCWSSQPGGTFTTLNLPELSFGLGWDTSALYTAGEISVTGTQDSDEDGMPDAWEIEYFGGDADPDDDPDHDGQSNLEEFIAGTNPTDPTSHFGVTDMADSIGGMVIRWQSVSNRTYGVYWTGVLTNSLQLLQDGIDYPQNSYTDTLHQAESTGFYKIEVQLQ